MNEPIVHLSRLLSDVLLPNLKAVQASQVEQIAANERLEKAIDALRVELESQFAQLSIDLTSCRAELAATQAALLTTQGQKGGRLLDRTALVH